MIASPTSLFPRERIFSRIDAVLTAPIGLVVAGNGSGKSTVLREYLARRGVAHVRLDGAPEHAIPEEFLRAFAAAFAQLAPAMASSVPTAATRFAIGADDDETVRWAREHLAGVTTTVFLDDLHHALSNPRIAAFIKEIVDGTVPHIRWLLAARNADALPVARWMANGLMDLPLDEGDLRITLDELRTAARVTKSPLDDEWLAALHERMQGWPLGLSVALTQGLQPDREPQRDELYDLLLEDALRGRSEQQQDELFATALAGRFDDDLLARLRLPSDTGQKLVATSLVFASSGGFAYHEPFRERLLTRIDALPERRSGALFDAVCDALAEVGRWTESIALLVRKGNPVRIAESLDRRGFDALDRGEATAVREALAAIPDPVVHGYPRVLAMKATLASMDGRHDVSEAWFQMAVSSSSGDTRREIVIHYGLDLVRRKRPDAVDLLEMEAGRPGAAPGWDAVLWALLGTAYVTAHRMNDARNAARIALSRIGSVDNPALQARIFHQAAYVAVNDRDFGAAKDLAERAVQVAEPLFLYDLMARALSALYVLAIDVDDDPAASRRHLTRLEQAARKAGSAPLRLYAIMNSYELEVLAGNLPAIEQLDAELRELEVFLTPLASETILPAQALRASWDGRFEHAYLLLAPGAEKQADDDRRAQRWAEAAVYAAAAGLRSESVSAMRASREALRKVDPTDRWALRTNAYLGIAEILLGHDGRARSAIADLRKSARTAGPRFSAMVDAIRAVHARWTSGWQGDPPLAETLDRLETVDLGGFARFLGALPLPESTRARAGLLTGIEKDILRGVADGATSKEIAADLNRSARTIDVHIRSICKKLGCSGRRQAVAFAIREGIIGERRRR